MNGGIKNDKRRICQFRQAVYSSLPKNGNQANKTPGEQMAIEARARFHKGQEMTYCLNPKAKALRDSLIHEANGLLRVDQFSNYAAIGFVPPNKTSAGQIYFNVLDDNKVDVKVTGLDNATALRIANLLGELLNAS